jgi:hypothetical protein
VNDDLLDLPPTPQEEAAARRLAEALESSDATADDTIAAARLLQALAAPAPDELAERRLRRELVREAGRARRMRALRAWAAAAVLVAGLGTALLVARHRPPATADLNAREAAARAAVARLLSREAADDRLSTLTDALQKARLESVLGNGGSGAARPSPTPGGPVS